MEAPFNAFGKEEDPLCLSGTRVDVLEQIRAWAGDSDTRHIFWLTGLAGTGKSTIARTVARELYENNRLGASFFFSRGGKEVGDASKFVTSIAFQLANNILPLRPHICEAIAKQRDIANQTLGDQWHQLVLSPLSKLEVDGSSGPPYILVVDALDECDDKKHVRIILQLLAKTRSLKTVQLRVFLTSRPEIPIRSFFETLPEDKYRDFLLHNISPPVVDHDILLFLHHKLSDIRQECNLEPGWPGEQVIKRLGENARGLFIWAATACRFIREGEKFAPERLKSVLDGSATTPERHLDEIYNTVLKQPISEKWTGEEKDVAYRLLKLILGCVAVLLSPFSIQALETLLDLTRNKIDQTLNGLHAIVDVPKDPKIPLRLHHPSFRDFLLTEDRCGPDFWVDEKQAHRNLTANCIRIMSNSLRQDVCGVGAPGTLAVDVETSQVEQCLSMEVQYACLYWVQHLQNSGDQLHDDDPIHQFLKTNLLYWLEALSWMRKTAKGVLAIASLESIALVSLLLTSGCYWNVTDQS